MTNSDSREDLTMGYTDKCIAAVSEYIDGLDKFEKEKDDLERQFKTGAISSNYYSSKRDEMLGTDGRLRATMVTTIYAERDSYIDGLSYRYRRDSETMDVDDVALLTNEHVGLSADDIERMFEKHSDSLGMQGLVVEVNAKRDDPASLVYYNRDTREQDARTFAESMISAATEGGLRAAMAVSGKYVPASLVGE